MLLCSAVINAETVVNGTCGDNLTWQLTAGGDLTISGNGDMHDYNPNSAPWHTHRYSIRKVFIAEGVTSIANNAFNGTAYKNITTVNIPESVSRIGNSAFWGTGITSIYIPKGVVDIGTSVFGYCDNLVSIIVDEENPTFDSRNGCNAIVETLPNVLRYGCATTIIPDNIQKIGDEAFRDCMNLASIDIPNSVEHIGSGAFSACNTLTSIFIPDGVKSIGEGAFSNCDSLKSVTIGRDVKSIENLAFGGCVSLSRIDSRAMIPPQIITPETVPFPWLGNGVFYKVDTTTCQLNVPIGSKEAYQAADGWKGFSLITEKKELTPSSEIIIANENGPLGTSQQSSNGNKRYYYASPVQTLDRATSTLVFTFLEGYSETTQMNDKNGFPFVNMTEFYLCDGDGNEIELNASNFSTNAQEPTEGAIRNICDKNFNTFFHSMWSAGASDYHNIIVTLPEGMELKEFSFKYYTRYMDKWTCHGIPKKIKVQAGYETVAEGTCGNNLTWQLTACGDLNISGSGDMYDYNYDAPWYDYRASIKKVTINKGVTSIGCSAFAYCENLISANIPDGVARIGWDAFWNTNISSVYIPKSVREIWNAAFGDCDNLVSIIVDAENPVYDSRSGCNAIIETSENRLISGCASTIIPDGVVNIAQFAFIGCDNLTSITFPESLNIIGYRAFWTCNGLTSIVIPKRVWHINQQAFGYCYNLRTISVDSENVHYDSRDNCNAIIDSTNTIIRGTANTIIPESVKAIGDFAFSGCLSMRSFNIPEGVTSIGSYAFCQCNNLVSVNIPQSVNAIGEYAFYNCYNLTSVELPQNVVEIKDYTFAYCDKLLSVSFPDGLMSIGNSAFSYCSSLKSIAMPNSVERVGSKAFLHCLKLETLSLSESLDTISDFAFRQNQRIQEVIIPNSVTHIGVGSFFNCLSLQTLTIGKNVKTLADEAFTGIRSISILNSLAATPPQILGVSTFSHINKNTCQLNVPVGSKAAYQAADVWKDFSLISEKEELTSIEQLEASSTLVWPTNIYDMNGRLVRENAHSVDGLTGGVYIINGRKVVINN